WVHTPETASTFASARWTNPFTEPRSNAIAPPLGRSALAPTACHAPAFGSSTPCAGGDASVGARGGANKLRPTTMPVAAEAAARPAPRRTRRRVPDGPPDH